MSIELNHTIVHARDAEASARWFAEMFGLPPPTKWGWFWQVETANGVGLDFISAGEERFDHQHYAFLVSDHEFDAIYGRIVDRGLPHWADPGTREPGRINHHWGGRGVYFHGNDGEHFLEIITKPYGDLADVE